jgi:transcriptional regulator GlxA family with amidase domain
MAAPTTIVYDGAARRAAAASLAAARGRALALRAEAWLRQQLSEPPTIATLCAAVGASERTLHDAFRQHLNATPKAYLKTLRLEAARRDLLIAAAGRRVTDVALDWGFLHFGWFSQDYKRLFGESPSQTLGRRRAHQAHEDGARSGDPRRRPARPCARPESAFALGA